MNSKLAWHLKSFDQLSNLELYALLRLRSEIFVVEQRCIFQDMDGKDAFCHHLIGTKDGVLMAYSRIVPPGVSYTYPSIGRVVVAAAGRGNMYGVELMEQSVKVVSEIYGNHNIRIGAQLYLKKFYESFGFIQSGDIYDEDGIDHIEMTKNVTVVE